MSASNRTSRENGNVTENQIEVCETREDMEVVPKTHTSLEQFGMLVRFMLPLIVTQMVPDLAEQVNIY